MINNVVTKLLYQINEAWSGSPPERKQVGYPIVGWAEDSSGKRIDIGPIQYNPKDWIFEEKQELTFRDSGLRLIVDSSTRLVGNILTVATNGYNYVLMPTSNKIYEQ